MPDGDQTIKKPAPRSSGPVLETTDLEAANDAGFIGRVPDPTPNENYTSSGNNVTPETDPAAKAAARDRHQLLTDSDSE